MNRAERRRAQRNQGKKEVTRTMTLGQIQQMKQEMTELVADELLMKVFGIATLVIHDKFGKLMKKEVDGKAGKNGSWTNANGSMSCSNKVG